MFTHKDIEHRTIFVIDCISERNLRVRNGELLLEEPIPEQEVKMKTLTKLPFQKILALFIIGHCSITTPLIEKCQRHGIAIVVMKRSLRPVFVWSSPAEANTLLRQRQHNFPNDDISIAKTIVTNKLSNQIKTLRDTRKRDQQTISAISTIEAIRDNIESCSIYTELMGLEGSASKAFFSAFFQDLDWQARRPRAKCDPINVALDLGYTILFNFIECFLRLFGFDLYVGVYHRLWYKRKSLVCDIMEPFRCIIDKTIRTSFNRKQFKTEDFEYRKGEYLLKRDRTKDYYATFFKALMVHKVSIFCHIQGYYRCFMRRKSVSSYPQFLI